MVDNYYRDDRSTAEPFRPETDPEMSVPEPVNVRCEYRGKGVCADNIRLLAEQGNKDLQDQDEELCNTIGHSYCSTHKTLEEQATMLRLVMGSSRASHVYRHPEEVTN